MGRFGKISIFRGVLLGKRWVIFFKGLVGLHFLHKRINLNLKHFMTKKVIKKTLLAVIAKDLLKRGIWTIGLDSLQI